MRTQRLWFVVLATLFSGLVMAQMEVWDFGAEQFAEPQYKNMLSVDEINSWFPDSLAGTTGVTVSNIYANDSCNFIFYGNNKVNHRLRSDNTALARYDNKSKKDASENIYHGYIYSNSGNTSLVYIQQNYSVNDIVEFYVGSNGSAETYEISAPSGATQQGYFTNAAAIEKLTFYIGENGAHKLYGVDEKLVVARIIRTPASYATLSGTVSAPADIPADYKLAFTNVRNGAVKVVAPVSGTYTVDSMAVGYDYEISLLDANGFIVGGQSVVTISEAAQTQNISIISVNLKTISGTLSGLPAELLPQLAFSFEKPDSVLFEPEINITATATDTTYTLTVENGVMYVLHAINVNDYACSEDTIMVTDNVTDHSVSFSLKPQYLITIAPTVASLSDLAAATFTFSNINEEGYVYEFTGTENIKLRNGVYTVKVTNSGAFAQLLTSNLTVNDAAVTKTIDFSSNVTEWDFKSAAYQADYTSPASTYNYNGLIIAGGKAHSGGGMSIKGTVQIPVNGPCNITIGTDYEWSYSFNGGDTIYYKSSSTATRTDSVFYYAGAAGYVTVTFTSNVTSYLWYIAVNEINEYKDTITVGVDKEYTTLNAALTAIRKMSRPNNNAVTVMIDPGNYEEMLLINMDSVRFINAAATPSIALSNKGVDIDANAVRITSYYGHGYNYYSMGSDYRWDARTLAVNKENGYTEQVNSGGSSATYWNSTVVVDANDFYAENIIFENSYNQYISQKESEDVLVEIEGASKGVRPTTVGNTDVQKRSYRERAAAISTGKNADRTFLNNCRIVGRQDSFYGSENRIACYKGSLMGACDYLFGEMNLTCYQTELALLTDEDSNDIAYITAPKTNAGKRGMLFFNCHVLSAQPGIEMNEGNASKPGLWGRPWNGTASEAIFAGCVVDSSTYNGAAGNFEGKCLISAAGWNAGLSSASERCGEYGCAVDTTEYSGRVTWAVIFAEPKTADNVDITLKNWTKGTDDWDPFAEYGIDTDALPVALEGYGDTSTAVSTIQNDLNLNIYGYDNNITITNIQENTQIQIFDLGGQLMDSRSVTTDVRITMPAGMYVISAGNAQGTMVSKVVIR